MSFARGMVLVALGTALQWVWSTHGAVWGLAPQVLLILTTAAGVHWGPVTGQALGFAWGLLLDSFGVRLFGFNALAFTLVGYLVGSVRRQFNVGSGFPQAVLMGALSIAYFLFSGVAGLVFADRFHWVGWGPFALLPLYNAAVAPLLFHAAGRLGRAK